MEKVWLLRPYPDWNPRMREFLDENIIAIGWPQLNSLQGDSREEIREKLRNYSLNYTSDKLGIATSTVYKFVNEMRIGDYVVVPEENSIYFGKIISDYFYNATKSTLGYPHQRKVEWVKGPVRRDDIPEALRQSLRAPRTLADLSHHKDAIMQFIDLSDQPDEAEFETDDGYVVFDYPVRLDKTATIKIPKNITQAEATRLGEFVKTLYFE